MTRREFEGLVEAALETIPRDFRNAISNMAIVVEDEPPPDLLDEMGIDPPDTLLGLYQGTPLPERTANHGNTLPDVVTLFQGPIEDAAEGDPELVVCEIGETLIHELGHYFGLSEEEIEEIEDRYWHDTAPDEDD
ncbi:MAG TPA: metallopeptidase family protein [Vicinamibacterales bacterium]|nr:metallopeptidase family protein [Vicinamibacterales bacterium]